MGDKKEPFYKKILDSKEEQKSKVDLDSPELDLEDIFSSPPPNSQKSDIQKPDSYQDTQLLSPERDKNDQKTLQLRSEKDPSHPETTKVSYGVPLGDLKSPRGHQQIYSSLKKSQHLQMAQNKINSLEEELDKLRKENEELNSITETLQKANEKNSGIVESLKDQLKFQKDKSSEQLNILKKFNKEKDRNLSQMQQKVHSLEHRLERDFQGIRKREKDLEHRLEIAKMEEVAVIKNKDQIILDLKRRIDDISLESESFRKKNQEHYKELQKKQQNIRDVIRALRLALIKLEGEGSFLNSEEDKYAS